ncbi:hypothetical protein WJX74_008617 [Apatococcus lobatus]|uniref:Uncharacterized protein n=1 Tax=Apatococcus lobatus TaxID=904363 RepID=A0AAW1RI35_9CHLO
MDVDSAAQGACKPSQTTSTGPRGENQPLSLLSPDPSLSDFALQQALLHSPQFEGSPNTIFKLKLAHLGFVEGSPAGSKVSQQTKVTKAKSPGKDSRRGCRGSGRLQSGYGQFVITNDPSFQPSVPCWVS